MKDHETEKRAVMTRLRYMEAYCQNPTPPPSPAGNLLDQRTSTESKEENRPSSPTQLQPVQSEPLPERQITQQHYENLAQQYHRRDTMDQLHASKINVLRGKQKRAVENLTLKRDRQIEALEKVETKELEAVNLEYGRQEAEIRQEFDVKRSRLERRWKVQALIEKAKMEKRSGLKFEALPEVVALEGSA